MHDVARAAGVSTKTVSRVVNGEAYVARETADRVLLAIRELGFRRNDMAHLLRKQLPTSTIGLVIEDLGNPFYAAVARAAEQVARRRNCTLIAASSEEDPEHEQELLSNLLSRRVDGLLLVPAAGDHRYLTAERRLGTPVVFLDRPPTGIEADVVLLDNFRGAFDAIDHLLRSGHKRIGLVSGQGSVWTGAERLRGYRAAFAAHGVPLDESLIKEGCLDVADTEHKVRGLLAAPGPPTAIFACNNRACLGALRAVAHSRPRAAVIGFDDFELAELLAPPVSVVSHDPTEMGRAAAELLFSRIDGDTRPPQRVTLPVHLVLRGTDGPGRRGVDVTTLTQPRG